MQLRTPNEELPRKRACCSPPTAAVALDVPLKLLLSRWWPRTRTSPERGVCCGVDGGEVLRLLNAKNVVVVLVLVLVLVPVFFVVFSRVAETHVVVVARDSKHRPKLILGDMRSNERTPARFEPQST